jgi:hypothetical protein
MIEFVLEYLSEQMDSWIYFFVSEIFGLEEDNINEAEHIDISIFLQ